MGSARLFSELGRTTAIALPPVVLIGAAGALFVMGMEFVTHARFTYPWLLYLLPVFGVIGVACYRLSPEAAGGNKTLFGAIRDDRIRVPFAMTPLIFLGTLLTHLGGGSAGREGTALQIGGGIAGGWANALKLSSERRRELLLLGAAAGFGAVFGTPLAGAIFVLEVAGVTGRALRTSLPLCLGAGYLGDLVARSLGAHHAEYVILPTTATPLLYAKLLVLALVFGLVAELFGRLFRQVSREFTKHLPNEYLRASIGGLVIIGLTFALGTRDYLGIGTYADPQDPSLFTLQQAFVLGGVAGVFWFWKLLFTVITLGAGFKGGEVTPLFIIGATAGNVLAGPLGIPVDLAAGLGLVAVFTAAARTPLAGFALGVEMFGIEFTLPFALVCVISQLMRRSPGLYATSPR